MFAGGVLSGVVLPVHRYWRIHAVNATAWNGQLWDTFFRISFYSSTDGTGTDLCLGKTATASTYYPGYPASYANDNNDSTRWASANVAPSSTWWGVDMVTPVEVHSIKLLGYWSSGSYFNLFYDIQFSDDGTNYTTLTRITTAETPALQSFNNL